MATYNVSRIGNKNSGVKWPSHKGSVRKGRESTGSLTSMDDYNVKARQAKVKDSYIQR